MVGRPRDRIWRGEAQLHICGPRCAYAFDGLGVDTTTVSIVLADYKQGSSAIGAILELTRMGLLLDTLGGPNLLGADSAAGDILGMTPIEFLTLVALATC